MDRFREPDDLPDVEPLPTIEEEASSKVDSFADWFGAACMGANDLFVDPPYYDMGALQKWADNAAIPELAAGLLHPRADVIVVCAGELRCRWVEQYEDDLKSAAARHAAVYARVSAQCVMPEMKA